ncbi:hypothetical protein AX14_007044 [Amanita brunnescens Koide BX004]|nr:hypothetical protein AX14_007044 [Amanita brunnescens Koide BX004]
MWCDNCCLLFPLRAGAIAWAAVITIYSIAGGAFFFLEGPYFFFTYPEWEIYGSISLIVALTAFISLCALSNRSYTWCSVARFLWFLLIVISAIRAFIIIVELERGKHNIIWECDNGGQLYSASAAAGYKTSASLPSQFCTIGFSAMNTAWIIALLVDLGFQIYMFFLVWRFSKRMEHYSSVQTEEEEGKY